MLKVMIVDDSALVRQTLAAICSEDSRFGQVVCAADPYQAANALQHFVPDVITLDIEMPRMDGLTFLKKLMQQHPIPVVICSSLAESGSETALRALDLGAVEIITKPSLMTRQLLREASVQIADALAAAAGVRKAVALKPEPKLTADAVIDRASLPVLRTTEKVVMVGASTGGTEALKFLLESLPGDCPGLAIVQHMPAGFTAAFAERLNQSCRILVKEAATGDTVLPGQALIAPGNQHLLLKRSGARYHVEVKDGPLVSRHRPSVDVLFRSAAHAAGPNALGVIMTGMGDDGARGLLEMRQSGAATIAQDEASCVVFGMPKEAIKLGGADKIMPLGAITGEIMRVYKAC